MTVKQIYKNIEKKKIKGRLNKSSINKINSNIERKKKYKKNKSRKVNKNELIYTKKTRKNKKKYYKTKQDGGNFLKIKTIRSIQSLDNFFDIMSEFKDKLEKLQTNAKYLNAYQKYYLKLIYDNHNFYNSSNSNIDYHLAQINNFRYNNKRTFFKDEFLSSFKQGFTNAINKVGNTLTSKETASKLLEPIKSSKEASAKITEVAKETMEKLDNKSCFISLNSSFMKENQKKIISLKVRNKKKKKIISRYKNILNNTHETQNKNLKRYMNYYYKFSKYVFKIKEYINMIRKFFNNFENIITHRLILDNIYNTNMYLFNSLFIRQKPLYSNIPSKIEITKLSNYNYNVDYIKLNELANNIFNNLITNNVFDGTDKTFIDFLKEFYIRTNYNDKSSGLLDDKFNINSYLFGNCINLKNLIHFKELSNDSVYTNNLNEIFLTITKFEKINDYFFHKYKKVAENDIYDKENYNYKTVKKNLKTLDLKSNIDDFKKQLIEANQNIKYKLTNFNKKQSTTSTTAPTTTAPTTKTPSTTATATTATATQSGGVEPTTTTSTPATTKEEQAKQEKAKQTLSITDKFPNKDVYFSLKKKHTLSKNRSDNKQYLNFCFHILYFNIFVNMFNLLLESSKKYYFTNLFDNINLNKHSIIKKSKELIREDSTNLRNNYYDLFKYFNNTINNNIEQLTFNIENNIFSHNDEYYININKIFYNKYNDIVVNNIMEKLEVSGMNSEDLIDINETLQKTNEVNVKQTKGVIYNKNPHILDYLAEIIITIKLFEEEQGMTKKSIRSNNLLRLIGEYEFEIEVKDKYITLKFNIQISFSPEKKDYIIININYETYNYEYYIKVLPEKVLEILARHNNLNNTNEENKDKNKIILSILYNKIFSKILCKSEVKIINLKDYCLKKFYEIYELLYNSIPNSIKNIGANQKDFTDLRNKYYNFISLIQNELFIDSNNENEYNEYFRFITEATPNNNEIAPEELSYGNKPNEKILNVLKIKMDLEQQEDLLKIKKQPLNKLIELNSKFTTYISLLSLNQFVDIFNDYGYLELSFKNIKTSIIDRIAEDKKKYSDPKLKNEELLAFKVFIPSINPFNNTFNSFENNFPKKIFSFDSKGNIFNKNLFIRLFDVNNNTYFIELKNRNSNIEKINTLLKRVYQHMKEYESSFKNINDIDRINIINKYATIQKIYNIINIFLGTNDINQNFLYNIISSLELKELLKVIVVAGNDVRKIYKDNKNKKNALNLFLISIQVLKIIFDKLKNDNKTYNIYIYDGNFNLKNEEIKFNLENDIIKINKKKLQDNEQGNKQEQTNQMISILTKNSIFYYYRKLAIHIENLNKFLTKIKTFIEENYNNYVKNDLEIEDEIVRVSGTSSNTQKIRKITRQDNNYKDVTTEFTELFNIIKNNLEGSKTIKTNVLNKYISPNYDAFKDLKKFYENRDKELNDKVKELDLEIEKIVDRKNKDISSINNNGFNDTIGIKEKEIFICENLNELYSNTQELFNNIYFLFNTKTFLDETRNENNLYDKYFRYLQKFNMGVLNYSKQNNDYLFPLENDDRLIGNGLPLFIENYICYLYFDKYNNTNDEKYNSIVKYKLKDETDSTNINNIKINTNNFVIDYIELTSFSNNENFYLRNNNVNDYQVPHIYNYIEEELKTISEKEQQTKTLTKNTTQKEQDFINAKNKILFNKKDLTQTELFLSFWKPYQFINLLNVSNTNEVLSMMDKEKFENYLYTEKYVNKYVRFMSEISKYIRYDAVNDILKNFVFFTKINGNTYQKIEDTTEIINFIVNEINKSLKNYANKNKGLFTKIGSYIGSSSAYLGKFLINDLILQPFNLMLYISSFSLFSKKIKLFDDKTKNLIENTISKFFSDKNSFDKIINAIKEKYPYIISKNEFERLKSLPAPPAPLVKPTPPTTKITFKYNKQILQQRKNNRILINPVYNTPTEDVEQIYETINNLQQKELIEIKIIKEEIKKENILQSVKQIIELFISKSGLLNRSVIKYDFSKFNDIANMSDDGNVIKYRSLADIKERLKILTYNKDDDKKTDGSLMASQIEPLMNNVADFKTNFIDKIDADNYAILVAECIYRLLGIKSGERKHKKYLTDLKKTLKDNKLFEEYFSFKGDKENINEKILEKLNEINETSYEYIYINFEIKKYWIRMEGLTFQNTYYKQRLEFLLILLNGYRYYQVIRYFLDRENQKQIYTSKSEILESSGTVIRLITDGIKQIRKNQTINLRENMIRNYFQSYGVNLLYIIKQKLYNLMMVNIDSFNLNKLNDFKQIKTDFNKDLIMNTSQEFFDVILSKYMLFYRLYMYYYDLYNVGFYVNNDYNIKLFLPKSIVLPNPVYEPIQPTKPPPKCLEKINLFEFRNNSTSS